MVPLVSAGDRMAAVLLGTLAALALGTALWFLLS
jgi:hypothetical protein